MRIGYRYKLFLTILLMQALAFFALVVVLKIQVAGGSSTLAGWDILVLIGVSAIPLLIASSYLARGVSALGQAVGLISAGRLGVEVPVRGNDEFSDAIKLINTLSARLLQLTQQQETSRTRLAYLAHHDPVTDLMNRRRFQMEMEKWIRYAARYKRQANVLVVDLDKFKYINDTFGQTVGDRVLADVALILKREMRETDFIGRLGGDQFGILLTESATQDAVMVANRLLKRLAEADFEVETQLLNTTASIGIAGFPDHGTEAGDILAKADMAMSWAKDKGRNRCHVFTEGDVLPQQIKQTIRWEDRIKRALKENRFHLLYQPIISLSNNKTEVYEALLRMEDGDGKFIAPGAFLDTAERFGLIEEIDQRVVRMACEKQVEAQRIGIILHLAINLSAHEFNNMAMCDTIKRIIAETSADPKRLIFEITETKALANIHEAERFMHELTAIGCRFALDDFGSGFTSLSYLKTMPIDIIKIDGSFVQKIDKNHRDRVLVKAVTEMGRAMGMKVTAEFVENESVLKTLRDIGVDHAQGYFIGKPAKLQ